MVLYTVGVGDPRVQHSSVTSYPAYHEQQDYSAPRVSSVEPIKQASRELSEWWLCGVVCPDDHRLFVGDLGNEVNDDVLTKAFVKYTSFAKAKVRLPLCQWRVTPTPSCPLTQMD